MRRVISMVGAAALLVVLGPTAALAKGPTSATIEGPGIDGSIDIGGEPGSGEPGSAAPLGQLAEHTGFWAALGAFGAGAEQPTTGRPAGDLGPEYTLTWIIALSDVHEDHVVQRLYPYAEAGPVTYTEADQPYLGGPTIGGWYVGGEALTTALVEAGVPERPPARGLATAPAVLGIAGICALGLLGVVARRRSRARRGPVDALAHA